MEDSVYGQDLCSMCAGHSACVYAEVVVVPAAVPALMLGAVVGRRCGKQFGQATVLHDHPLKFRLALVLQYQTMVC
jgi:hypothetical protein